MNTLERPYFCYYVRNNVLHFRHEDGRTGAEPLSLKQETKEQALTRLTAQLGMINPIFEDLTLTPATTEKEFYLMAQDKKKIQDFPSKEEAFQHIHEIDLEYADNFRFGWRDHTGSMAEYENKRDRGCCGSIDVEVTINGRLAMIGCNYGH